MSSISIIESFEQRARFFYPLQIIIPGWVASFGVSPDGDITCDQTTRDGYTRTSMVKVLEPFFEKVCQGKERFVRYDSLNPDIEIYGPVSLDREALLEYVVFSGVVDIKGQILFNLLPELGQAISGSDLYKPSIALNGRNYWHSQNLVIDFKHSVILARNYTRQSIYHNQELAQQPLSVISEKYDLGPIRSAHSVIGKASIDHLPDASDLAIKNLREFLEKLPPK